MRVKRWDSARAGVGVAAPELKVSGLDRRRVAHLVFVPVLADVEAHPFW